MATEQERARQYADQVRRSVVLSTHNLADFIEELADRLQVFEEREGKMQVLADRWGDGLEGPEVLDSIIELLPGRAGR